MTDIILCGCFGRMGRVITELVSQRQDCRIVCGVDAVSSSASFPTYTVPSKIRQDADVIIDFSNPSALAGVLEYAVSTNTAAVIATTGLNEQQINLIKRASERVPIFFSANMSMGVSLLTELSKTAARILGDGFDIEIVEMHHNQKLDAPSGTALLLADSISSALDEKPRYEYNRHAKREKRSKNEIGIHSVRGGTIVGEHEVIFAGTDEVIKLSHSAGSKKIFAVGAINAAVWINQNQPGLYTMQDLVNDN